MPSTCVQVFLCYLLPRDRRRRQIQTQTRVPRSQIGDERARRERLAHRHGVDPDRFVAVDVQGNRQVTEALTKAAHVLSVANRLIKEVRRHARRTPRR